nr:hypothetical protein [Tanacetum cinerariifolium]
RGGGQKAHRHGLAGRQVYLGRRQGQRSGEGGAVFRERKGGVRR